MLSQAVAETCDSILIADDDPAVLSVVAEILRRAGYNVLTARNAQEATERASTRAVHIGLLVLNHSLDAHPGSNLVDTILPHHPGLKVLRFSGHMEHELRARGEIAPESLFIQKPFMPRQLVAKVRDIIGPADRTPALAADSTP